MPQKVVWSQWVTDCIDLAVVAEYVLDRFDRLRDWFHSWVVDNFEVCRALLPVGSHRVHQDAVVASLSGQLDSGASVVVSQVRVDAWNDEDDAFGGWVGLWANHVVADKAALARPTPHLVTLTLRNVFERQDNTIDVAKDSWEIEPAWLVRGKLLLECALGHHVGGEGILFRILKLVIFGYCRLAKVFDVVLIA